MEFNYFSVNSIFNNDITIVTKELLPEGFSGKGTARVDCSNKISIILDEIGWASAKAQQLIKPITSGSKLKLSDHILYLLTDPESSNGRGTVVGLLKIGRKKLFMFDLAGYQHEVEPLCILDFYIHESKQRTGCGKKLFEYMLQHQNVRPQHMAIDRPSEKFLSFLYKHYGLEHILPQMNNFVVFKGFFDHDSGEGQKICNGTSSLQVTRRVNNQMSSVKSTNRNSAYDLASRSPGRFSAHKPESTMGMILHDGISQSTPRSEVQDDALNGSSQNEHTTFIAGDASTSSQEATCSSAFHQPKCVDKISEDKSAYRHSRLW
ncbi:Alpha-tubulin N-acetyltransferase 1 [Frankliniella fusca]|uniref:Alpha-tubulin N-acetyltransferase n=1 Tax=Frankliniella fusca TaxID=407009 RepID=A0AAE1LK95_9NEOP|nr:Alpha-tubulin N-acetyltransferase 1 [Frankliniella fusca]